jgi:hypothetical protein
VAQQLRVSPREEAAMKLGEARDKKAIQPLLGVLTSESEGDTLRYLALEALGKIGGEEVKEGIINAFKNGNNFLREMIVSHLDPEKGVLRKTGLTRTVLYGKTAEEVSVIDRAEQCYKEGSAYWNKRDWKKALAGQCKLLLTDNTILGFHVTMQTKSQALSESIKSDAKSQTNLHSFYKLFYL